MRSFEKWGLLILLVASLGTSNNMLAFCFDIAPGQDGQESSEDLEIEFISNQCSIILVYDDLGMPQEIMSFKEVLEDNGFGKIITLVSSDKPLAGPDGRRSQKPRNGSPTYKAPASDRFVLQFLESCSDLPNENRRLIFIAMGNVGQAVADAAIKHSKHSALIAIDASVYGANLHNIVGFARIVVREPSKAEDNEKVLPEKNVTMVVRETKTSKTALWKRLITSEEVVRFLLDRIFEYGLAGTNWKTHRRANTMFGLKCILSWDFNYLVRHEVERKKGGARYGFDFF